MLLDNIARPKPRSGGLASIDAQQGVNDSSTNSFPLQLDNRECDHNNGMRVVYAVIHFLNQFFMKWCGLAKSRVTILLTFHEQDFVSQNATNLVAVSPQDVQLIENRLLMFMDFIDLRLTSHIA